MKSYEIQKKMSWNLKKLNEKCKNKGNAQATKSTFIGWKMCLFIFGIYVFSFRIWKMSRFPLKTRKM